MLRRLRLNLAAGLLLLPGIVSAAVPKGMELPACAHQYAPEFGVDLKLIQAIRIAEGGKVGQSVCGNKNATCDHGPMQINDGWFDGRWGVSLPTDFGVTKTAVLGNECQNIRVGMWVLRQAHVRVKDWYQAVAAYNAGITNRKAGYNYADRVFRWYKRLDGSKVAATRPGIIQRQIEPQAPLRRMLTISGA